MSTNEPFPMSDEIRLQLLKSELNDLFLIVKMEVTVNTTLEAYRQYLSGELPDEFKDYVGSDQFKDVMIKAIKAEREILTNLKVTVANMAQLFGIDFNSALPSNTEEFFEMTKDIRSEVEKKIANGLGWDIDNPQEGETT